MGAVKIMASVMEGAGMSTTKPPLLSYWFPKTWICSTVSVGAGLPGEAPRPSIAHGPGDGQSAPPDEIKTTTHNSIL